MTLYSHTHRPSDKKQAKMIQTQQKIIESLTAQNQRFASKQNELYNRTKELKHIIANFMQYNTKYDLLLHELDTYISEYEAAKNEIHKLKECYKKDFKKAIRRIRR